MQGTLKRITSNHTNLRTPEMKGEFLEMPIPGKRFTIVGESLTPENNARVITTTPIKTVNYMDGRCVFTTENSEYELSLV